MVEIERRFLVDAVPDGLPPGDEIRQGYVAIDDTVSVRVRATSDRHILTIKGGTGLSRTEVELDIDAERFDSLWALAGARRISKTRHRLPQGASVIELDVFADTLDGLVIAEVEFATTQAAESFEPPAWFGREVTTDPAWNNAALSLHGRPDR